MPSPNDNGGFPVITFGPSGPRIRCRCLATPSRLAVVQEWISMNTGCDAFGDFDALARAWKRESGREPQDIESWESFLKRLRRTADLLREKQNMTQGSSAPTRRKSEPGRCRSEPSPARSGERNRACRRTGPRVSVARRMWTRSQSTYSLHTVYITVYITAYVKA